MKRSFQLLVMCQTLVFGILVNVLLLFVKFKHLVRYFKPSLTFSIGDIATAQEIYTSVYRVLYFRIFGFLIFRPTCLKKSLILFRIFNRWGFNSTIHLGVKKQSGEVEAHSWITLNSEPVFENQSTLAEYKLIFSYK